MTAQLERVNALQEKVSQVIDVARRTACENVSLKKQVEELQQVVGKKDLEIAALKEDYRLLKLAKVLSVSEKESGDARQQIAKIVREIDKCISLLNR